MNAATIPCHGLAHAALVARIASLMSVNGTMTDPPFSRRPGFCCFCNHALREAYRVTRVIDGRVRQQGFAADDPEFKARLEALQMVESPLSQEMGSAVAGWPADRRNAPASMIGFRTMGEFMPDLWFSSATCCDVLTNDVFNAASRLVREREGKRRSEVMVQARAREMAATTAARRAANAMAKTPPALAAGDSF